MSDPEKHRVEVRDLDGQKQVIYSSDSESAIRQQYADLGIEVLSVRNIGPTARPSQPTPTPTPTPTPPRPSPRPVVTCPYCGQAAGVYYKSEVTTAGKIFTIVLFLFMCLPLFWIGLLIRERKCYCNACHMLLTSDSAP